MSTGKPLRADALRNRARILDAAEKVFGVRGTAASTEDVAKEAGVGIATVFRHFPTKELLVEAVLAGLMRRFADDVAALPDASDPGEAFFTFLDRMVEMSLAKNTYAEALIAAGHAPDDALADGRRELPELLGRLLARAQEAGSVRPDVTVPEVIALMVGVSRAFEHFPADVRPGVLRTVFDGLRR